MRAAPALRALWPVPSRSRFACAGLLGVALLAGTTGSAALDATPVPLPSGHEARLYEVIVEQAGAVLRYRFVAPWIDAETPFDEVSADIEHLCQEFALAHLPEVESPPAQIVVSLSREATEFGVANPDITQFFESFAVRDGACLWEPF